MVMTVVKDLRLLHLGPEYFVCSWSNTTVDFSFFMYWYLSVCRIWLNPSCWCYINFLIYIYLFSWVPGCFLNVSLQKCGLSQQYVALLPAIHIFPRHPVTFKDQMTVWRVMFNHRYMHFYETYDFPASWEQWSGLGQTPGGSVHWSLGWAMGPPGLFRSLSAASFPGFPLESLPL